MATEERMAERHDTVALAWVKDPVAECLGLARQALERYAGDPADPHALAAFSEPLHAVRGCLVMLELEGASLLADEMQALALMLGQGRVPSRGEALGALFRALEQLPIYLERLRSARRDLPLVVLPLLNDLRSAHGAAAAGPDRSCRDLHRDMVNGVWGTLTPGERARAPRSRGSSPPAPPKTQDR